MIRSLCLLLTIACVGSLHAQLDIGSTEEILVPLAFSGPPVPGAHGTIWSGDVYIHNGYQSSITMRSSCQGSCLGQTGPGFIGGIRVSTAHPEFGMLLTVDAAAAPSVTFSARLFETTRKGQPRGIDIPVVREREFFTRPAIFIAVPTGPGVRVALRLYDPQVLRPVASTFTVEVFKPGQQLSSGDILGTTTMSPTIRVEGQAALSTPGFDIIADLAARFPAVNDYAYVNIRVTPQTLGEYWGMVSVTDNDTQTVSIITAQ